MMKKAYVAPSLEIELYQLDANIASNCGYVVKMGDYGGGEGQPVCDDYLEAVGKPTQTVTLFSAPYNVNFWEQNCDCYTTAQGDGFFTS